MTAAAGPAPGGGTGDDRGPAAPSPLDDAALAAALLALDPAGLGGVSLRAPPGPARDRWLDLLRGLLPAGTVLRRVPPNVPDGRLLGGLDLAATLRAGHPVAERGLLAEADGGLLLLAMAERLPGATAARLAAVLDTGEAAVERDGLALRLPARLGLVALDEGMAEEERPPAALLDRLAFHVRLDGVPALDGAPPDVPAARARLPRLPAAGMEVAEALCATAAALGIASLRAPLLALRAARAAAALAGRGAVAAEDAALAARLVLAPRATVLPAMPDDDTPEPDAAPPADPSGREDSAAGEAEARPLEDLVLAAARAAIPPGLLARLAVAGPAARTGATRGEGRVGQPRQAARRGRPVGTRAGDPRGGGRLSLVETLRAAAPWQRLRHREGGGTAARIEVRREDFRILRLRRPAETTTVFVVDASGSAALHRLAEAKGAAELLLAECYARRDRVALVAFRGAGAELLLPPTRSLARARRCLAALPGGGGTPLADGLDAARAVAAAERRHGRSPLLVLLTDGRANLARGGQAVGRARAEAEALEAGRALRAEGGTGAALVVDTAPRPQPFARGLAEAMGAPYLPLPVADPATLSGVVRAAAGRGAQA